MARQLRRSGGAGTLAPPARRPAARPALRPDFGARGRGLGQFRLDGDELELTAAEATEEVGEEEEEDLEEELNRRWFVIHTYSGYENKVKTNLEHRIESMGVGDKIYDVVIPTEEEVEIKDGQ